MIPEGSKTPNHSGKRVRASEAAVSAVLRAMAANGIAVGKICIVGGQVEIHCAGEPDKPNDPYALTPEEKARGLKAW